MNEALKIIILKVFCQKKRGARSYAADGNAEMKFWIEWNLSHHIEIIFRIWAVEEERKTKAED